MDLSGRAGFRGADLLDLRGEGGLSVSCYAVRSRGKGLLRGILSGGVWNGVLLERVRGEVVLCRF